MTFSLPLFISVCYVGIQIVAGDAAYEQGKVTLEARGRDLSFCFGVNSICSISHDLYMQCDTFSDDYDDRKPYYECICGNGYVSADESCTWCEEVYQLSSFGFDYKKECKKYGASIAPMPSDVLSAYSAWNATYTGIISGAAAVATTTKDSSDSDSVAQTTGSIGAISTPVTTLKPGATKATTEITHLTTIAGAGSDLFPIVSLSTGPFNAGDDQVASAPTASAALRAGGDLTDAGSGLQAQLAIPFALLMFGLGLALTNLL